MMEAARHLSPVLPSPSELPRLEDLPRGEGYSAAAVESAFDTYRRHSSQLLAQLRVLQAAPQGKDDEPRSDTLRIIREAAEFAESLEREAQEGVVRRLEAANAEITQKRQELEQARLEIDQHRSAADRERAQVLAQAAQEADELRRQAEHESRSQLLAAEQEARKVVEAARHEAAELLDKTRSEVSRNLDWASERSRAILASAREGATRFLTAGGMSEAQAADEANVLVDTLGEETVA